MLLHMVLTCTIERMSTGVTLSHTKNGPSRQTPIVFSLAFEMHKGDRCISQSFHTIFACLR